MLFHLDILLFILLTKTQIKWIHNIFMDVQIMCKSISLLRLLLYVFMFIDWKTEAACNFIKKETLAHVFSCEFCEISKNSFSYRTPLVAASGVKTRVSYEIMTMKRQLKISRAKWRALLWVLWRVPGEILRRIQRFWKGAALCAGHHGWPILKKIFEENFRFQMV